MAEKEATVYIVDVGKSMDERRNGREVTDLEWAMQYIWDRITTTVNIASLQKRNLLTGTGFYWAQNGDAGRNRPQN